MGTWYRFIVLLYIHAYKKAPFQVDQSAMKLNITKNGLNFGWNEKWMHVQMNMIACCFYWDFWQQIIKRKAFGEKQSWQMIRLRNFTEEVYFLFIQWTHKVCVLKYDMSFLFFIKINFFHNLCFKFKLIKLMLWLRFNVFMLIRSYVCMLSKM